MSKGKIEDIKNVGEFYQALRNEVANTFNSYEKCGIFDGWTDNQKKECFGFAIHILSNMWLPIQKHYTKKERKKYEKIIENYEEIFKSHSQQYTELKAENESLKEQYRLAKVEQNYWVDDYNKQLKEKEQEIEKHNEYFQAFACDNFEEFQEFIGTFMLTPHEEQTLIQELRNKLKTNTKQVCDKIREKAVHSNLGYMGRTEKGYYTVYAGELEQIEKGEKE